MTVRQKHEDGAIFVFCPIKTPVVKFFEQQFLVLIKLIEALDFFIALPVEGFFLPVRVGNFDKSF